MQELELLLDIIIVKSLNQLQSGECSTPCRKTCANAVERKKNKYRGSFPVIYFLLRFVMSMYGEVGSKVHALIKEIAIRKVKHRSETHSDGSRHLVEGTEVARLWRGFSFVLQ